MSELFPIKETSVNWGDDGSRLVIMSLHSARCIAVIPPSQCNLARRWKTAACGVLYKLHIEFVLPPSIDAAAAWCYSLFAGPSRWMGMAIHNGQAVQVMSRIKDKKYQLFFLRAEAGHVYITQMPADDDLSMVYYLEKSLTED